MKEKIETFCKGIFRSYKTFRKNGEVMQHATHSFQQWEFNPNRTLIITQYQNNIPKVLCQTDDWGIEFNNRHYYIKIGSAPTLYEILTLNHSGLVITDPQNDEKVFYAKLPVWEHLINQGFAVM